MREVDGMRILLLTIGYIESSILYSLLRPPVSSRPLTHATMTAIIAGLGGSVVDIAIDRYDSNDRTYYATLKMRNVTQELVSIDLRPSDAIAIAVTMKLPIHARIGQPV
jgi:bifunctional DNase/RNase